MSGRVGKLLRAELNDAMKEECRGEWGKLLRAELNDAMKEEECRGE